MVEYPSILSFTSDGGGGKGPPLKSSAALRHRCSQVIQLRNPRKLARGNLHQVDSNSPLPAQLPMEPAGAILQPDRLSGGERSAPFATAILDLDDDQGRSLPRHHIHLSQGSSLVGGENSPAATSQPQDHPALRQSSGNGRRKKRPPRRRVWRFRRDPSCRFSSEGNCCPHPVQ